MGLYRSLCSIGFTIIFILDIAVPSNAAALRKRDPNCDTGPGWASPVLSIGGGDSSDTSFVYSCETQYGHDYTPVSGIEVWRKGDSNGGRIAGVQFTYGSGTTSQVYGQEDTAKYPSASITFAPGELVKNAILYGDGHGNWLGHIHIETTKGQNFDAGCDTNGINPYGINIGSGLLYGANIVTHESDEGPGSDIASLAFLFLGQPIDHISINNIAFNNDPSGTNSGISPQNVVVGQWYDGTENNVGYSLSPTYSVAQSYVYSQSTSFSFGGSIMIEVEAELFGIGAKEDDTFTCKMSAQTILNLGDLTYIQGGVSSGSATTVGTSSTTAVACVATGTLAPGQGVKVTGTYQTGKGTFDYVSQVTVHLKDGTSFQYTEKGTLTNVAYNQCFTTWETANDAKAPNSPGMSSITAGPSVTSTAAQKPSLTTLATSPSAPSSTATSPKTSTQSSSVTSSASSPCITLLGVPINCWT